jgi:ubiquinone/menaquinone biosynthesis C-methylase UbiE
LGVDLSEGMIAIAKNSVADWKGASPDFLVMDAEALDLPDTYFDAVTSLCAVRHFPNIARGLAEMHRVLKPSGVLVVSFGYARPIAPLKLVSHIAKRVVGKILDPVYPQLIGPVYLTRLAHDLLPEPIQVVNTDWGNHVNPKAELLRHIRKAGFKKVEASWWGHEVIFDSVDEFWKAQTSIVTEVRKRLMGAPPEAVERLKELFFKKAEDVLKRGGQLIYPYGAYFARGFKQ